MKPEHCFSTAVFLESNSQSASVMEERFTNLAISSSEDEEPLLARKNEREESRNYVNLLCEALMMLLKNSLP